MPLSFSFELPPSKKRVEREFQERQRWETEAARIADESYQTRLRMASENAFENQRRQDAILAEHLWNANARPPVSISIPNLLYPFNAISFKAGGTPEEQFATSVKQFNTIKTAPIRNPAEIASRNIRMIELGQPFERLLATTANEADIALNRANRARSALGQTRDEAAQPYAGDAAIANEMAQTQRWLDQIATSAPRREAEIAEAAQRRLAANQQAWYLAGKTPQEIAKLSDIDYQVQLKQAQAELALKKYLEEHPELNRQIRGMPFMNQGQFAVWQAMGGQLPGQPMGGQPSGLPSSVVPQGNVGGETLPVAPGTGIDTDLGVRIPLKTPRPPIYPPVGMPIY